MLICSVLNVTGFENMLKDIIQILNGAEDNIKQLRFLGSGNTMQPGNIASCYMLPGQYDATGQHCIFLHIT